MIKPIILSQGTYSTSDLEKLKKENPIWKELDLYLSQLGELFEIDNPTLKFSPDFNSLQEKYIKENNSEISIKGDWIYFPWSGYLLHTVSESDYNRLRTNRNKNLITEDEQKILYNSCVAFAGLSIGSSVAVTLAYQGIAKNIKVAEFDTLETTNLNRLRAGIHHIGTKKLDIAASQLYEINPYTNIESFEEGLSENSLDEFLGGATKPKIVMDAIDDLKMKIKLRLKAREKGVCVVMFTNLGDGMLVDIERYDLDKNLSLFNGRIGTVPEEILNSEISKQEENNYVLKIVGMENVPQKAIDSVKEIGKTLVGRPQLASTVTATGGIGTYLFRQIILGQDIKSGRKLVKFEDFLV